MDVWLRRGFVAVLATGRPPLFRFRQPAGIVLQGTHRRPRHVFWSQEVVGSGATSEEEERELEKLNTWPEAEGLSRGTIAFDFADPATGEERAVFDIAWPAGVQEELRQPVLRTHCPDGWRLFTV